MPTYKHLPTGKRFLFIHIPRTAGRFLEENFKYNGFQDEYEIWNSIDGIEVAHFHRELYEKYLDVKGIPHITIVRNPIDRFFSTSIFLKRVYGECQEEMEDTMMFYSMLDNFPLSQGINWFRSQLDFISEETNVWKLEDGFENNFSEWMSNIIQEDFKVDPLQEYARHPKEIQHTIDRTPELIDNIRRYYRRDIEQLYPELAAPFEEGT